MYYSTTSTIDTPYSGGMGTKGTVLYERFPVASYAVEE